MTDRRDWSGCAGPCIDDQLFLVDVEPHPTRYVPAPSWPEIPTNRKESRHARTNRNRTVPDDTLPLF